MYKHNLLFNVGIYFNAFIGYVWTTTILTPPIINVDYEKFVTMNAPVSVTLLCTYKAPRNVGAVYWDLDSGVGVFKRVGILTVYNLDKYYHKNHGYVNARYSYKCTGNSTSQQISWTINNITWENDGDRWKCTTLVDKTFQESNVVLINVKDTRVPTRRHGSFVGVAVGVAVGVIILVVLVAAAVFFVLRRRRTTNGCKSDDQTANRSNQQDAKGTASEDGDEYDVIGNGQPENHSNDAVYYNEGIEFKSANPRNNDTTYYNEGANVTPYEALSQPGQDPAMYTSLDASCEDKVNSDETNMEHEYLEMGLEKS